MTTSNGKSAILTATKREQHQNQLDLLEQLTIANRIIARKQAELTAAKTHIAELEEQLEDKDFTCSTVNTNAALQTELDKAREQIKKLNDAVDYSTGYIEGQHGSLAELMNWKNSLAAEVVQANTTITALQAKIKELEDFIALDDSMQADYLKMGERELELLAVIAHKDNALLATGIKWPVVLDALALTPDLDDGVKLFAHPPITSQRELELLAAIEQMREALDKIARLGNGENYGNSIGNTIAQEALALTPDLSALKEHAQGYGTTIAASISKETCKKCGGEMKPGQAIGQTSVGSPDFVGGVGGKVVTMSPGGSGTLIDCMKCVSCGWSVTEW